MALVSAVRRPTVQPINGDFFGDFSGHADGERRGLDRVGGRHAPKSRQKKIALVSAVRRPTARTVKRTPTRTGGGAAATMSKKKHV